MIYLKNYIIAGNRISDTKGNTWVIKDMRSIPQTETEIRQGMMCGEIVRR